MSHNNFDRIYFLRLIKESKPKYIYLFMGIIFLVLTSSIQVYLPTIVGKLVNNFTNGLNYRTVTIISVLIITSAFFSIIGGTILGIFGEDIIKKLRSLLLKKLVLYKISYFDTIKSGELTSHISSDTLQIKQVLSENIPQSIASIITIMGTIYMMIRTDWHMTLIIFLTIPILIIIIFPIMTFGSKIGNSRQEGVAQFSGITNEIISKIRLIKTSNAERRAFENAQIKVDELYYIGKKEALFDAIVQPVSMMIFLSSIFGIITYGLNRISSGEMKLGVLFSFLMYLFNLIGSLPSISAFLSEISKASGATKRIQELLLKEEENFSNRTHFNIDNKVLNVTHMNFSYSNNPKEFSLKDISFKAHPNKTIAFVGPSGSGKSTIFSLLERFYEPTSGTICFDKQNILDIDLEYYRRQIGFVSQETGIMSGTIRSNLTFGLNRVVTEKEIWSVLELSYATQFVKKMPLQLDTEIGEQGINLSGGQRQRLAIARAFLRNPKILMLDEATANLDSESEVKIQEALTNLMKNRTTLIIAHRLSTIINSDCIYFVEDGRITGSGKHNFLVETHSLYKKYVDEQFKLNTR